MSEYKKAFIRQSASKMLKESQEAMTKKIEKILKSGAIDFEAY